MEGNYAGKSHRHKPNKGKGSYKRIATQRAQELAVAMGGSKDSTVEEFYEELCLVEETEEKNRD